MSFRRGVARFNRRYANRVVGGVLSRLPGFGLVHHRGRRSGKQYRTPVKLFVSGSDYLISLPYGAESDWVRNVLAAGGGELTTRGQRERLQSPRLRVDAEPPELPAAIRALQRRLGITEHLIVTPDR